MWNNFVAEMTRGAEEIVRGFAHFLPRVLEMLVIVLVGWVIAIVLRAIARSSRLTLVYSARDERHNQAVVLRERLLR